MLATFASAPAAWGHEEGETTEGYLLVQQALGHLAHDTSMSGIDLAMKRVDDALETDDQQGVDVAELEQGRAVLESGDVGQARVLLQDSIEQAAGGLPAATGMQTGTHEMARELPDDQNSAPGTGYGSPPPISSTHWSVPHRAASMAGRFGGNHPPRRAPAEGSFDG